MACPYFEPRLPVLPPTYVQARLPLIEEYEGLCQAGAIAFAPEASRLFRYCNHGNVQGACTHFPPGDVPTSLRYQVEASDPMHLEVLIIEERQHWPHAWRRVHFEIAGETLNPPVPEAVIRAQVLAFCRSYLKRFAA